MHSTVSQSEKKSLSHTFPFCCNEIMLPSSTLHASYLKRQISQCDKQFSSRLITAWISQTWQPINAPIWIAEADSVMCCTWIWLMKAGGGHFQYQQMHGWERTPNVVQNNQLLEVYVREFRDAELSIYNYFEPWTCPKVRLRRMHFLGSYNTARKLLIFYFLLSKFKENEAAILLW